MRQGQPVWVGRVYLLEGHHRVDEILAFLHDEQGIANVHAFRAIAGTGGEREIQTASLLALSLRLPVMVEFIADEASVRQAALGLNSRFGVKNVLLWPAELQA
jgi:PII-like signaling protein